MEQGYTPENGILPEERQWKDRLRTMITQDDYYHPITRVGRPPSSGGTNRTYDRAHREAGGGTEIAGIAPKDLRKIEAAMIIGVVPECSAPERVSDSELMVAVAEGNCAAFEQLYDRHVRRCFGLAVRIVQEPSLAEDVVQEVFTKLWSRPDTFSPERGTFNSWLLTVVRNGALDQIRQAKSRSAMHVLPLHVESTGSDTLIDMLPDAGPTPHDAAWTNETAGVVRQALQQLPASEYQTITLAYFGGLTQREIADKLQQPLGTVKTRTRSALHRLHHLLAAHGAFSD